MCSFKDKCIIFWAVLMTLITLIVCGYAYVVSVMAEDLTATIALKDKDIQDMQDHINKITGDYNQLKLEKSKVDSDLTHCIQELQR